MIPEDTVATMHLFNAKGQVVLALWHRSIHSSDMDWHIACNRVKDPSDPVTSCQRNWISQEHDKPPRIDRFP